MGNEAILWEYLRDGMHGTWLPTRHEERGIAIGVPDLSYVVKLNHGWIELKAGTFSASEQLRVKFRPEQLFWLRDRWNLAGGGCFVLLWVLPNWYAIFEGHQAFYLNGMSKHMMMKAAIKLWVDEINFDELHKILQWRK